MRTRLRHVAQINPLSRRFDRLRDKDLVPFLPMERVWPGERLDLSEQRPKSAVAVGYTRFESGDVIVPKITPTFEASRAILVPDLPASVATGTTELHVVRPGCEIYPRYLLYILHAHDFLKIGEAAMYGVAGQKRVPDDLIRDWVIDLPPLGEQRRIADLLDAETAQIDHLTELRVNQLNSIDARVQSYLSGTAETLCRRHGTIRVRHVLQKIEQGWSPQCEDRPAKEGEWGVVKAGCVNGGTFDAAQHKALPSDTEPQLRYRLRAGDLLMSRASGSLDFIGSIGVVPDGSPHRLLLCDKIYRLRMDRTRMTPHFVALMLGTHKVRQRIRLGTSGADGMANNLPTATVTNLPLPDVPLPEQASIVEDLYNRWAICAASKRLLTDQLALLVERRQALITAAVTGQIDVTTARGVAV